LLTVSTLLWGGCSLGGTWRVVEIDPPGAAFPFTQATFDATGRYTATGPFTAQGERSGDSHSMTGTYNLFGAKMNLSPEGGPTLSYRIRRRLDGKVVMVFRPPNQDRSITATFTRVE